MMPLYARIHLLRGLAALLVVLHHVLSPNLLFFNPLSGSDFGRAGVSLFFVISAFILYAVCRQQPAPEFLARRLLRVVPLYWLATSVKFALLNMAALTEGAPLQFVREYLLSLLFIPHFSYADPALAFPMLYQGWTLNLEMAFYAAFALILALRLPIIAAALAMSSLAALHAIAPTGNAMAIRLTDPVLLLFAAGIVIGELHQRFSFARLAPLFSIGLLGLLFASLADCSPAHRNLAIGLAAIATIIGSLGADQRRPIRNWPILQMLGDASYAIYLSHTFLFIGLVHLLSLLPLAGWSQFLFVTIVTVMACSGLGILVYLLIERPLTRFLRRLYAPARRLRPAAEARA